MGSLSVASIIRTSNWQERQRQNLDNVESQQMHNEAQELLNEINSRTVKMLAPVLISDAEQHGWLVTRLLPTDKCSWRRTERLLNQLRKACSELHPTLYEFSIRKVSFDFLLWTISLAGLTVTSGNVCAASSEQLKHGIVCVCVCVCERERERERARARVSE
jgi:hypothetical protein